MVNRNESVDNLVCLKVGETLLNSYKKNLHCKLPMYRQKTNVKIWGHFTFHPFKGCLKVL